MCFVWWQYRGFLVSPHRFNQRRHKCYASQMSHGSMESLLVASCNGAKSNSQWLRCEITTSHYAKHCRTSTTRQASFLKEPSQVSSCLWLHHWSLHEVDASVQWQTVLGFVVYQTHPLQRSPSYHRPTNIWLDNRCLRPIKSTTIPTHGGYLSSSPLC